MAKYLISGQYSPEGVRGLQKDKAAGRVAAVTAAVESLGGKIECLYFALGDDDMYGIVDFPDTITAIALGIAVSATGVGRIRTTALLTVAEVDQALAKSVNYRPPAR